METKTPKEIVEGVLDTPTTKKLWSSVYTPVLPFTPQSYSMGAILPAMLFMFRWGHRRGKGTFIKTFGKLENNKVIQPTIEDVANKLSQKHDWFEGFAEQTEKAILGDMLLTFCLENKNHFMGRTEQIQRAFPTHYFSSWIDLPEKVANLRNIPEMLVSILVEQEEGEYLKKTNRKSYFNISLSIDENIFLSLFGNSIEIKGDYLTNKKSDQFTEIDEKNTIGLDQLLTTRSALSCGEAPGKALGSKDESENIPNRCPIAKVAAKFFREDLSVFLQAYGGSIPRQSFLQMLESCFSLGITNIYFSTVNMLLEWESTGVLPQKELQSPWTIFVDCSCGNDTELRKLAEESMDEFLRRFNRFPIIMMCLRILEDKVKYDRELRNTLPPIQPDATEFINLLGSVFHRYHPRSGKILDDLDEKCLRLADALKEEGEKPAIQENLRDGNINPVLRMAEAICLLMEDKNQNAKYIQAIDSSLMIDQPNGLAKKRKIQRSRVSGKKTVRDARSIVLTNTMLDFLVHRHLRKASKKSTSLSFVDFIRLLRERYGIYIDQSPPDMSIPFELLHQNRRIFEKRLRDLGVLLGVNDAESMKRLKQRFKSEDD